MIQRMWSKAIAVVLCGVAGVALMPACDQLGLDGSGGTACDGAGGFGGDGPVCEIEAQSPCNEKCQADYDAAALQCGSIQIEADRKSCQDGAYEAYKQCRAACTTSRSCTDMFVACQEKGKPCTRTIEGSSTLCDICRADCKVKKHYTFSECYTCGFDDP